MKTIIATTPIRPRPTSTPPFGSLAIVNYLRKNGIEDVEFYHIDGNRPRYEDVLAYFRDKRPGVVGISAVVSTAYAYTKRLAQDIKRTLPDTLVVVGGNLAASAEVLLRRAGVDLCVTGEGERTFLEIVRRAETTRLPAEFSDIPGVAYIDSLGALQMTPYAESLPADEVFDFRWEDLASAADLGIYIYDPMVPGEEEYWLRDDPRTRQEHRYGKKLATLRCSKGCVARCTFCHRWDKGIRYIPVDLLIARIEELIDSHNVGFLVIGDENFGTDRRWLSEFCAKIKPLDVLWRVAGMRVNCVSPEIIATMRDAGCVAPMFGMETGSERMLQIMEKKVKLVDNYNAMKWTVDSGLYTVVQLVLGMPGETRETIQETIDFCKYAMTLASRQNPNDLSVNYAQALPGTPLYEFARSRGMIGAGLDGEEIYLLRISDKDAHDEITTLNFTDSSDLECQTWRTRIQIETNYHYVRTFGLDRYRRVLLNDTNFFRHPRQEDGFFANPKRLVDRSIAVSTINEDREIHDLDAAARLPSLWGLLTKGNLGMAVICYPVVFYRLRALLPSMVLVRALMRNGPGYALRLLGRHLRHLFVTGAATGRHAIGDYKSLRKIVNDDISLAETSGTMAPLRRGR